MNGYRILALSAVAAVALVMAIPAAQAQISISIGPQPQCPYGDYDYAPYRCSPSGYYGPQYFNGGGFVGVEPWSRGDNEFHGTVNNRMDPQPGYHGRAPQAGEQARGRGHKFKGNEDRDGRGNGQPREH